MLSFKFQHIADAVYAGVDGIGIGGAQILRYMDYETGMHGPYVRFLLSFLYPNTDICFRRKSSSTKSRNHGMKQQIRFVVKALLCSADSTICTSSFPLLRPRNPYVANSMKPYTQLMKPRSRL